uniref:BUB1 mitotic checkpoint serine/threonine kinase Bb n=1 Tax=Astyanax mexicanus TaxID=7994 RepID=W5KZ69_ASTMX
MAEGEAEWELCKENIQPLRRGRAISALHQALQQQEGSSAALNQQKQAYETELRMYDGDDPLDVWDRYIKWTEQNYPQGGKESSFSILLERVVMKFTEEKKYHNDARYVDLWIRFAEGCSDPLDVYRYMQSQGIGTMQASFYISWSEEYEKRGNSRMADTIFQDGLKCGAEPLDKLQQFHKALQARVCRQMMTSVLVQEKADEPPEPQRISLVELKAKGKKKTFAPINRVTGSSVSILKCFFFSLLCIQLPQKSRFGHTVMAPPPKANFQPFVEESDQPPAVTPCKVNPAVNTVLSARKPQREEQTPLKRLQDRQQHMQLQQEDESKTGVKSMYCKELLFSGISEFCFEELRAERYRQKCSRRLETGGDATEQPQSS